MLNRIHAVLIASALAAGAAAPAFASGPRYGMTRLSNGPRPDRYVLVRTEARPAPSAPYALTGPATVRAERRLVHRWVGSRYVGPIWTTDFVAD
jgi:hypothetical protein